MMLRLTFILFILVSFVSCKKKGCTDENAANHSSEAKKDDGSCSYQASVIFWWDVDTKDWLFYDNVTNNVDFYIDNEFFGSKSSLLFWSEAPDCGDFGNVEFLKNMGSSKSTASTYAIKGDNGATIWSGSLSLTPNDCIVIKLTD